MNTNQPMLLFIGAAFLALLLLAWAARRRRKPVHHVLIDGSNVMHWGGNGADISIVRSVAHALVAQGYRVGVIFDANAGYKIRDSYMNESHFAQALNLDHNEIMVSPKGRPADGFLLQAARDMDAPIVTNDRFRDWQEDFPECAAPGRLIHGIWRDGAPQLRMSSGKPG